jgi:hypothetical protein
MAVGNIWKEIKNTVREALEDTDPEQGPGRTTGIQFQPKEVLEAAINNDTVFITELKQTLNSMDRRRTINQIEEYCKTKNALGMPLVKEQKAIDLLRRKFV